MNNYKRNSFIVLAGFIFLVLFSGSLFAQSNDIVDALLIEEEASFGKTAYLVLIAANLITEDTSVDDVMSVIEEQGWKIDSRGSNEPINQGEISLLLMKSLGIKGGIMYSATSNARYACRELSYLGLIRGNKSPSRKLSGEEAVGFISRVIEWSQKQG